MWPLLRMWSLTTSCRWRRSWAARVIDRRLMPTIIITMVIIILNTTSNSINTSSSMRTQRRMKTPQRHTAHITYSTYLLSAHRLPLLQHFRHTFLLLPPPPMEEEQGVSQVVCTRLINNTHLHNSTLPAINSTMRYDPPSPSPPQLPPSSTTNPPPSSFHPAHAHLTRHTSSPASRSRSRSRPPSSSSAPPPPSSAANGAGGVGPARRTRARRNNSISGTSPPPFGVHHGHGRPHTIVIPGVGWVV